VLRRDLAPSLPQPRFGIEPAGQDPGQTITPGRRHYRSVRSRMPVLSATIFHAVFWGRRIRNLPAGADNRLVAGSSPPSPTTHSHANRDFPWFDEYPAVLRGRKAGLAVSAGKKDRFRGSSGPSSLASKNRFPGAWEGAARDSVRMRQRPVCSQEFREELGHDGHAIVDAHAIAGLPLESYVSGSQIGDGGKTVALRGKADQITSA
jgi:hypothetical protein